MVKTVRLCQAAVRELWPPFLACCRALVSRIRSANSTCKPLRLFQPGPRPRFLLLRREEPHFEATRDHSSNSRLGGRSIWARIFRRNFWEIITPTLLSDSAANSTGCLTLSGAQSIGVDGTRPGARSTIQGRLLSAAPSIWA